MGRKVVISRYNEPLDWVSSIECDYIIYNKGERIENADIPEGKVINVPNEGREAETFLRYIISNYNNLPDSLVFVQGNPFDHFPETLKIINSDHADDIIGMGPQISCDGNGVPSYPGLPLRAIQKIIMPDLDTNVFNFTAGAQMLVTKSYILSKPLLWWESVFSTYNAYWFSNIESGYGHKPGVFIAHAFERLWEYIFKYEIGKENE
jgi:hypothetical protein